ncbi:FecR domain-containing protein [Mucilaginibacter sp. dw_454]|uniref:FecR domain-containing protein n=1 Tax=Mucilaginibacter sp. dw_454 TaxID=2720079 RepID=UPI001BD2D064|nr:FecR domain-containing protein [Mucilaginibacter sp. dw_454]
MTSEERAWILIARSVSGDITLAEADELELIFVAQPELRAEYDDLKRLRLDSPVASSFEERQALERGLQKLDHSLTNEARFVERHLFNHEPAPLHSNKSKWWMMAAASLTGLLIVGFLGLRHIKTPAAAPQQQLATRYGNRIHAILPDGSSVWLNSGSTIKYAENLDVDGKREVTLNGEAYFDVKHDTVHPFIVHAGKMNVVVLGTAFNVRAYPGDKFMETTLIRGKVEVINKNKPGQNIILYPNEKVTLANQSEVTQKSRLKVKVVPVDSLAMASSNVTLPDDAIAETAWVNNKLIFKKENFKDLAKQLDRWYNIDIVFDDDNYASKEFTGTFKGQNIDEVMHALQLTEPFHYSIKNNQVHIW